jgi:hypothetical protein
MRKSLAILVALVAVLTIGAGFFAPLPAASATKPVPLTIDSATAVLLADGSVDVTFSFTAARTTDVTNARVIFTQGPSEGGTRGTASVPNPTSTATVNVVADAGGTFIPGPATAMVHLSAADHGGNRDVSRGTSYQVELVAPVALAA